MGLLGKKFRGFVGEQIKERQKALGEYSSRFGQENKTKAFLTNTPWIRLASSVDLNKTEDGGVYNQMKNSGLFSNIDEFTGSQLAKKFVLFGGVNSISKEKTDIFSPTPYSGINNPNSSQTFGGAYGFGSWDQIFSNNGEGYKPMPGITNMDFSYKNDGALSQASVTVKAFSRSQFQIIDVLFQRPGYTVLLEFGHSVFLDNQGTIQHAGEGDYSFSTSPFQELFNNNQSTEGTNNIQNTEEINHYNLSSKIYKEKSKWNGNYEGAFMKITKFNWKYNKDGSYDITINLVGIGDIISSLKTNVVPLNRLKIDTDQTEGNDTDDLKELRESGNFLIGNSQSTLLNRKLYEIYKEVNKGIKIGGGVSIFSPILSFITELIINNSKKVVVANGKIENFPLPVYDQEGIISSFKEPKKTLEIENSIFLIRNPSSDKESEEYDNFCYITFGYLVSLITKYINLEDNKGVPHIFFDFNYGLSEKTNNLTIKNDENFLATYPGNMSSDPSKILIPFKSLPNNIIGSIESDEVRKDYRDLFTKDNANLEILDKLKDSNSSFFVDGDERRGRLERVYLDINYIAKVLDENTIEGECKLIDFINQILRDINENLGGINEFRVIFNQDKQLISFVSEVPITSENGEEDKLDIINTLGIELKENIYQGSFVKEVDLKAELNDDFATTISVGAQSNGNRLQGNSGAFSLYNKGLTDRVIPQKIDSQEITPKEENDESPSTKPLIGSIISEDFIEALEAVYDDFSFESEYIDIIRQYNSSLSPFIIGELEKSREYTTPFFLPFNLGLTLHGLGGVRIYDGFKIDGKMLPPSYDPDSISLIIKSLSHSVSLDGWTTKIETLPKPKPILKKINTNKEFKPILPDFSTPIDETNVAGFDEDSLPFPTPEEI